MKTCLHSWTRTALVTMIFSATTAHADMFDCVVEPSAMISVVAAETGIIRHVDVKQGDYVRKDDVLVRLDDDVQKMQVELNRIRASTDVEIRAAEERLALRQKEFARAEELTKKNIASQTRLDETEIEVSLTQLSLEQAQIAQKLALVQLAQAEELLERRTVRALVDGVVLQVNADPGEYAGEQYELMTLAQVDPLWIKSFLPIEFYDALETGKEYRVFQTLPAEREFKARLLSVDRVFDVASGTFGVLLTIPNEDGKIPAGLRCKLDIGSGSSN